MTEINIGREKKNFEWFNEPSHWELIDNSIKAESDEMTDFWQRTQYGFRNDNGHLCYTLLQGNFVMSVDVDSFPINQYDQAGLMVRISPSCWLKTSIEYEGERPAKLGAVVTNSGYSDWSTQDIAPDTRSFRIRIVRTGPDYTVSVWEDDWRQIRLARLLEDDGMKPVMVGPYLCSPRGDGYRAVFSNLALDNT